VVFEVRLQSADGIAALLDRPWPDGVVAVVDSGIGRLLFGADQPPAETFATLAGVGAALKGLPTGTGVELLAVATGSMDGEAGDEGRMRFGGELRDGLWQVAKAWPPVPSNTLVAALTQAREAGSADHDRLLDAARRFGICFGETWACTRSDEPEGLDDDEDALGEALSAPIQGALIWTAPTGRRYYQTMALLLSEDVAGTAQARERALLARGCTHLTDLVCDAAPELAVRGYAKDGGVWWGLLCCRLPDSVQVLLVSLFERGVLITSADRQVQDDPAQGVLRTADHNGNTRDLIEAHEARLAEATAIFGPPSPAERNAESLAKLLERLVPFLHDRNG
jgi:hypothetical protein